MFDSFMRYNRYDSAGVGVNCFSWVCLDYSGCVIDDLGAALDYLLRKCEHKVAWVSKKSKVIRLQNQEKPL